MFIMSTVIITGSTTLRELLVSGNDNGDNWISVITERLQSNKTLAKLDVSGCGLTAQGTVMYMLINSGSLTEILM